MHSENNTVHKAVKTISFMAVIIFIAKFMGLIRETLIAGVYGLGYASDIINTSTQIPLLFFDMTLGVAILSTFVPIFNKYLERYGRERAIEFAGNFITIVAAFATIASIIGMIFANQIVAIMARGYDAEKIAETAHLLRILFPAIIFTAVAYTAVGILQSFGEFNIPSIISLVSNSIMILYMIFVGDKLGFTGVIVSMLVAWAIQLFIQIPSLRKYGFKYKFKFDLKEQGIKEAALLAIPVLISSWIQPLCVVINISFGSSLGNGAVSGLNWANKIYIIMVGVFAYAVTNFVFPRLSRFSAGDNSDGFCETTRISIGWIVYIITFVSALFLALSTPIIKIVFQHGNFTVDNAKVTATALFYYSFGMVGYAICEVLNKSFYAIQDGKTPMVTSIFGIFVNFLMAWIFVSVMKMGIAGLALASAISSISIALVLLIRINKSRHGVVNLHFVINIFKTLFIGALSCITAKFVYSMADNILSDGIVMLIIKLCIASLPALAVYAGLSAVLKIDEFNNILRLFKARLRKGAVS